MTERYKQAKVYKLINTVDNFFYIGSTCLPLHKRLYKHKYLARERPDTKVYKYLNEIGWDNVKIILINEYCLENKQQLLREEDKEIQKYINDENCLNSQRSFTGLDRAEYKKMYNEKNKDKISKYGKDHYSQHKEYFMHYYEEHKEEKAQKAKEIIICDCGKNIRKRYLTVHKKTKMHIDFINNKNDIQ